jgi:hypothetical protein
MTDKQKVLAEAFAAWMLETVAEVVIDRKVFKVQRKDGQPVMDQIGAWEAFQAGANVRQKYDDTLLPFLALMRKELHANSHKGDREGWIRMDRETAMAEVHWHVKKLGMALEANDTGLISEHAADVANCAMMLADIAGVLAHE